MIGPARGPQRCWHSECFHGDLARRITLADRVRTMSVQRLIGSERRPETFCCQLEEGKLGHLRFVVHAERLCRRSNRSSINFLSTQ